jgi:hypothetical protein
MKVRPEILFLLTSVLGGCARHVQDRLPIDAKPSDAVLAGGPVSALIHSELSNESWVQTSASPDGRFVIDIIGEQSWLHSNTGFYELRLRDQSTGKSMELLSLWESDGGSGPAVRVGWSADSQAARIVGSTVGFRRRGQTSSQFQFDLLYVVQDERLYNIGQPLGFAHLGGSPSNNAFQPSGG